MRRHATYMAWASLAWLGLGVFACGVLCPAAVKAQSAPQTASAETDSNGALSDEAGRGAQPEPQRAAGTISGTVVDQTGAAVAGARITLVNETRTRGQETFTGDDGQFTLFAVSPGAFRINITAEGFAKRATGGLLGAGENMTLSQIALMISEASAELRVTPSQVDVAEDQIKVEEKQRLLGVVPNFYVSYDHHAVALTSRQKFELAWKTSIDPVNFGVNGVVAGIQQAQNDFSGYGQGTAGYARRYGASYGNFLTGTYIGGAILPSLLKQDPRYFYKGTGGTRARILYAMANAVICKGDDGSWQANYSGIIGSLASGAISNLYYPAKNRDGVELTFENALINIGATAATNILQEFVFRKLTPSMRREAAKPPSTQDVPPAAPSGIAENGAMGGGKFGAAMARQ